MSSGCNCKIKSLVSFDVTEGNPNYQSRDGVLFSTFLNELVKYPANKGYEYIIPDGVASIGPSAFESCSNLSKISIPSTAISIGDYAFESCSNLVSINIHNNVRFIGNAAFRHSSKLSTINVDETNQYYQSENGILFSTEN